MLTAGGYLFYGYTRDPKRRYEYPYPLNLLSDLFDEELHSMDECSVFKAIKKYGTMDNLNIVMKFSTKHQRMLIQMWYKDLLSVREIAERLNRAIKSIEYELNYAIHCLYNSYLKRMLLEGEHPITHINQLNMPDEIKQILMDEGIINPFVFRYLAREEIGKIPGMDEKKMNELLRALDILLIFDFYHKPEPSWNAWWYASSYRSLDHVDILCLDLDAETRRLLRRAGANNIRNLTRHSEAWLRRIPGMDDESVNIIVSQLKAKKYSLNSKDNDLSNPLEDVAVLGLRTRVLNILAANNIHTIGQLSTTSDLDLCDIRGIGPKYSDLIWEKLYDYKIKFARDEEDFFM